MGIPSGPRVRGHDTANEPPRWFDRCAKIRRRRFVSAEPPRTAVCGVSFALGKIVDDRSEAFPVRVAEVVEVEAVNAFHRNHASGRRCASQVVVEPFHFNSLRHLTEGFYDTVLNEASDA